MEQPPDPEQHVPLIKTTEVKLTNITKGLGFSIVGGSDNPHIPGHSGVFISRVRDNTAAAASKKLHAGDRVVSVNGIDISNKTHDESVEIFKSCRDTCTLVIEPDAERILLTQPSNLILRSPSKSSKNRTPKTSFKSRDSSPNSSNGRKSKSRKSSQSSTKVLDEPQVILTPNGDIPPLSTIPVGTEATSSSINKPQRRSSKSGEGRTISTGSYVPSRFIGNSSLVNGEDNEDCESTISLAPSIAHSVIDDVPRTPKKATGFMDPNNPSILTEVLFVSVGAIALITGAVIAFKYIRKR